MIVWKKLLAVTLAMCMVISFFEMKPEIVTNVKAAEEEEMPYWEEEDADCSFVDVDSTNMSDIITAYEKQDEYKIESPQQLLAIKKMIEVGLDFSDKTITFTKDIDLQGKKWIPMGSRSFEFNGTMNGNGHKISNMTFQDANASLGFIYKVGKKGIVENLTFVNPVLSSKDCYVATVAQENNGRIIKCNCISNNQEQKNLQGYVCCGIVVYNYGLVTGCASNLYISSTDYKAAGIAFNYSGGKVENCFVAGQVNSFVKYGAVCNENVTNCLFTGKTNIKYPVASSQATNCYYSKGCVLNEVSVVAIEGVSEVTDEQLLGTAAQENLRGFDFEHIWQCNDNDIPTIRTDVNQNVLCPDDAKVGFKSGIFTIGNDENQQKYPVAIDNKNRIITVTLPPNVEQSDNNTLSLSGDSNTNDVQILKSTVDEFVNKKINANSKTNETSCEYTVVYEPEKPDMIFTSSFDVDGFLESGLRINSSDGYGLRDVSDCFRTTKFYLVFHLYGDTEGISKEDIIHQWFTKGLKLSGDTSSSLGKKYTNWKNENWYYGCMTVGDKQLFMDVNVVGKPFGTVDWETNMKMVEKSGEDEDIAEEDKPAISQISFTNVNDHTSVICNVDTGNVIAAIVDCTGVSSDEFTVNSEETEKFTDFASGDGVRNDCSQKYYNTTLKLTETENNSELKSLLDCTAKTVRTTCTCLHKEWVVKTEPTYEEEGSEEYKCTDCGAIYDTRDIDKLEKTELSDEAVQVTGISDMVYTGDELTQSDMKVEMNGKTLTPGTDYDVEYENNTEVGEATVRIIGKVAYKNTIEKTFLIKKRTFDMTDVKWNYTNAFAYDGTEKSVAVTGLPEGLTVQEYTDNKKKDAGTYVAKVTFAYDTEHYEKPEMGDLEWKINPCTHNWSEWKTTKAATYDDEGVETRICSNCGETQQRAIAKITKPTETTENKVTDNKTTDNKTTVTKPSKVRNLTVKAIKSKGKKKQITLTWMAVKKVAGYEVQISMNKKFKKNSKYHTKTYTYKSAKAIISALKKNTKYFVRVRAYKLNGKTKVYGSWSKVVAKKTVK